MHARLGEIGVIIRLIRRPVFVTHYRHHVTGGIRSPDEWRRSTSWVYTLSGRPETDSNVFQHPAFAQCAL